MDEAVTTSASGRKPGPNCAMEEARVQLNSHSRTLGNPRPPPVAPESRDEYGYAKKVVGSLKSKMQLDPHISRLFH